MNKKSRFPFRYCTFACMRLLFFTFLLFCLACDNPKPASSRIDKIAQAFCECTGPLVALNQEAANLASDTTAQANFQEKLKQIQEAYNNAKECSGTVVAQYGQLKKEEFPLVEKALAGKCPDLATQRDLLREMLGE